VIGSGNTCAARSSAVIISSSTMMSSTRFHRSTALSWLTAGSQALGAGMMPAIIADSARVNSEAGLP